MKAGDNFKCPHCGRDAFLKKESVMDGWRKIGEVLKCASCSAVVEELKPSPSGFGKPEAPSSGMDKLAGLLGAKPEARPSLKAEAGETRFCRDCAHLVAHPFLCRCELHKKDVNPMDDCADFKPKSR